MVWNISGYDVLIDEEDYERLNVYKYHVHRGEENRGYYYFERPIYVNGKRTMTKLHRDVMGCVNGDGKIVDHKYGNTLDCRKGNLRFSTTAENAQNQKTRKNNTSGVKGVNWHKAAKKWHSRINVNGTRKDLGFYTDLEDAKEAYTNASKEFHGEFRRQE